eukprot:6209247-Pleurochrysis_carterae.AAC.1
MLSRHGMDGCHAHFGPDTSQGTEAETALRGKQHQQQSELRGTDCPARLHCFTHQCLNCALLGSSMQVDPDTQLALRAVDEPACGADRRERRAARPFAVAPRRAAALDG